MAWFGNADMATRTAINRAFYNRNKQAISSPKHEMYRSDKYIYYSDGSKESW